MLFLFTLRELLPPLEVAITFGMIFFVLSWVLPRKVVTLPSDARRRAILGWTGVAGSLLVVVVATISSALAARRENVVYTGVDGWFGRPAPLLCAVVVVAIAALILRAGALPAPGERAIAPRRPWHTYAPRPVLWVAAVAAALLALTALWQTLIATFATEDGRFFGRTAAFSDLPIYMRFNQGYGYIVGVGWPNYLATLVVLVLALLVFIAALRSDANRPVSAGASMATVRVERDQTARVVTFILLGGLVTTLGAVWMHAGSIGEVSVGFGEEWVSDDQSFPRFYVGGGYDAFAGPMNLAGYALQGVGVAFLLRIATDTARSALMLGRTSRRISADTTPTEDEAAATGARR